MKILFTQEQETIRRNIQRMVKKDLAPRAGEIDERDEFPEELLETLSAVGLFSILVPEEYGGLGGGLTELCIGMEEVAKASVSSAGYVLGQAFGALGIRFGFEGNEHQKVKYYPEIMKSGNVSFATTEPQGGSDLGAIRTKAVLNKDHYVINGRKSFITNGGKSKYYVTLVKTNEKSLSFFWIEKDTPGFSAGKREKKMGFRGVPLTELIFEDAIVPKSQLLGKIGKGLELARAFLSYTRTGVAAWAIGNAQGALENAIEYVKIRPQFGKMISDFQAIRFMIAEMQTKIEVCRSLIYRIASMVDQGVMDDVMPLASMAKWYAADTGMEITTNCVQIMGGYGYTQEFPVERMMRDAKALQIFEGANEIQKVIIAKTILG
jgi:alkylation response protein AidB-like acyl-CoA dehydrogenase